VSSSSVQLQTLTHRPHARMGGEPVAVFRVTATKTLWHKNLNLLPQEVFPLIAKELLHLGIDQYDLTLTVRHDHGIGSGFQEPTKLLVGFFALGDVCYGTYELQLLRFKVSRRTAHHANVFHRAVRHQQAMFEIEILLLLCGGIEYFSDKLPVF